MSLQGFFITESETKETKKKKGYQKSKNARNMIPHWQLDKDGNCAIIIAMLQITIKLVNIILHINIV